MGDVYRAVQATGAHDFELVERERVEPGHGHVRIRVEACGVCHSDALGAEGLRPDPSTPVVPGHEVVGVIDAVGPGVGTFEIGDRVGVGFLYGHCGECEHCRRGDFVNCLDQLRTGSDVDGGYAESMIAKASGLVRVPDGMAPLDAAPLLCAGLTTFMGLTDVPAAPGGLIAVQGIGGLGHLAIQYASRLGHEVVAISRGGGKEELVRRLGADHYIDSESEDPGRALAALGGAAGILTTATSGAAMSPLVPGLREHGRLVVLGAAQDPLAVQPLDLVFGARSLQGRLTGTPAQNEDSLRFSRRHGIRSVNEVVPLSEAPAAYGRMMSGKARFRIVLDAAA
ncbi:alcohol dehydrogenase catalytic domain-containing protein [Streptomyces fuscigenes]|uniref:alcohol dehydrogenase catalytic domain-containing protein n=1 Tax=Streptomyces fuscigenes TaxID=1528880 RepID=UPI001F1D7D59|nr:alcohol dehydrogenase catalytic domain-containing protein [Streptomyces fuscigenes]MCF3963279.1 alcohol dehydrogenase catalytic domain-containing protein [Streptomyces fuscigenes]